MSLSMIDRTYLSSDGVHQIHATVYRPPLDMQVRGVVQIAHGMVDHSGRYRDFAFRLAAAGYAVGLCDHLGHGRTARCAEDFGFFAEHGGVDLVLRDMHTLTEQLRAEFVGCPIVLVGHSMGSFLSRLFAVRYPHDIDAHLIFGTGGPNPLLPFGRALAAIVRCFAGPRHRSRLIASLAFAGYNSHFDPSEGQNAWLSRDKAYLERDGKDPYTDFIFTVSAYQDLFRMLGACNRRRWFRSYPKELPTLLMSGTEDPVGAYGKGPSYVYRRLLMAGVGPLELHLYEGARHELFNETCRDEVIADVLAWLGTVAP
ncbi:MAG: alpha/beta fold hydrolase [Clostridia bacterium]|nr:alpha/beta fold hydrolase [Clostridia bacterium]